MSRVLPERSRNRTGARTYAHQGAPGTRGAVAGIGSGTQPGGQLEPICFRCAGHDSPVGGKYVAGLEFNRACFCDRVQCSGVMADRLVREESA